jgi:hypothetical protein
MDNDDDQQRQSEDALANLQAEQWDTFEQLFNPIFQACIKHGRGPGEARAATLSVLKIIVGCKPPDNFGLPPEDHDLFD